MARILVAGDAAFMRKVLTDMLVTGGHEVVGGATNGIEAVARYQELRPDLITLDIAMPEKDGRLIHNVVRAGEGRRPPPKRNPSQ
jgi:two-component system, chemotaxis family, chemotaxis protein CheY